MGSSWTVCYCIPPQSRCKPPHDSLGPLNRARNQRFCPGTRARFVEVFGVFQVPGAQAYACLTKWHVKYSLYN